MKRIISLAVVFSLLTYASFCSAGLIIEGEGASTCWDDGDGVLQCDSTTFGLDGAEYTLDVVGNQFAYNNDDERELAGHLVGDFNTDGDPTLRVTNYIDNETDFAWTDYHVKIKMGIPFDVTGASVANENWYTVPVVPPTFGATQVSPGVYEAIIDYYAGTPVEIGQTLEFGYKLQFDTSAIGYCVEMTPTPEPASIVLLLSGLLIGGFVWLRKR